MVIRLISKFGKSEGESTLAKLKRVVEEGASAGGPVRGG